MPSTPVHGGTSSNTYLHAIEWGGWKWTDGSTPGTNITYFFQQSNPGDDLSYMFSKPAGTAVSVAWLANEEVAFRAAIAEWAKVANISFTEVTTYLQGSASNTANLVEHVWNGAGGPSGILGKHETPDTANGYTDKAAWSAYNFNGAGWTTTGLQKGGYGYITPVHEIGHALGLAHPHDNGGGSTLFPGVSNSADTGDFGLNQGIFTVMSYNDGWRTGIGKASTSQNLGWESGPMAFDIAAIQNLYGARPAATGNNTYQLGHVAGSPDDLVCIWDTGGTDKLSYSGGFACTIDLRAATLQHAPGGGGFVSYVNGAPKSNLSHWSAYTIAHGVKIENASGGSGADHITGNQLANILSGGPGIDTLTGGPGRDTLNGGGQHDYFHFNAVSDSPAGAGRDIINAFQHNVDDIDLRAIDAKTGGGNNAFIWIGTSGFHHVKGELHYKDLGASCLVQADTNGDGRANFEIFVHSATLSKTDFLL
jgi:serralysin